MGTPTRYEDDGADGKIMVYESYRDFGTRPAKVTPADMLNDAKITPAESNGRINRTLIYIRPDRTIYAWRRNYEQVRRVVGE
jgi:hypothetical protein